MKLTLSIGTNQNKLKTLYLTNNNSYFNCLYNFRILHLSDLLISNGLQPIKEIGP